MRIGAYTAMANDVHIPPGAIIGSITVVSFPLRQVLGVEGVENDRHFGKGDVIIGSDVWIGLAFGSSAG